VGTCGIHYAFSKLLFPKLVAPYPATWDDDPDVETKEKEALEGFERILAENEGKIAAMIIEPLCQGSKGLRMCRPGYLEAVVELARKHSILVIFDEVVTGFGRTGKNFAFNHLKAEAAPDLLCFAKGITGGFLPLGLTVASEKVYSAFLGDTYATAFMHGHSYAGSPISTAAALKSFEILQRPETQEAIKRIERGHKEGLKYLKATCGNRVHKTRSLGTIAAFELTQVSQYQLRFTLVKELAKEGLVMRPSWDTIHLVPPYAITEEELKQAYEKIATVVNKLELTIQENTYEKYAQVLENFKNV